ncbi:hypothetical protein XENOCAPTIV_005864 [Xenoophorus captivus]|uniref:Uncharacterized protein n=1 Tax=Xenoophorus captivus TaxID=1517983 RepID=A0ABV0RFS1_9TELE
MLSWMNGIGSSAFYASLLRNESPSVIVSERREREDLYLCLFPLVAFLSEWCGSSIIFFLLSAHPASLSSHASTPRHRLPGAAGVGGWEMEEGWRTVGKGRKGGKMEG